MNGSEAPPAGSSGKDSAATPHPFLPRCLLWFGAWGAVLLPVLSHCGYRPQDLEFLCTASLCLLLAVLSAALARLRAASLTLLLCAVLANTLLYFGQQIFAGLGAEVLYAVLLLGFALLGLHKPRQALLMAGVAGAAQVLSAVYSMPPRASTREWTPPPHTGQAVAPIVHLLLDEHTGLATVPDTPRCRSLSQRITELYLSRGFLVFTHAYSEHTNTITSLPYLLNPMSIPELNREQKDARSFLVKESYLFRQAGKYRKIDATFLTEMDLSPALKGTGALARSHQYSHHSGQGEASSCFAPAASRFALLGWTVLNWFYTGNRSPVVGPLVDTLPISPFLKNRMKEPPPVVFQGALELSLFRERLQKEASASTYYFGHFLVPHHPFCLDENGTVLPKEKWGGILVSSPERPWTESEREDLFALHLGQALYAGKQVVRIADTLDQKFSRKGSIILVHSDHGSRLTLPIGSPTESAWAWERLSRNCFLAVRIPGVAGGLVEEPVSMDRFLNHLAKRDFSSFELAKIPAAESNPFVTP